MDPFSDSEESSAGSAAARVDIIEQHSDDEYVPTGLVVDENYAARFEHNAARKELHRFEEKHGKEAASRIVNKDSDDDDDSVSISSSDESEDEDGEQMTADVDAAILATLAKIRRKDESIYDASKRVFDEERHVASSSKLLPRSVSRAAGNKKKVTLSAYQRQRIQELMKTSDDPARALADATASQGRNNGLPMYDDDDEPEPLPYTQEQEQLREQVTRAFQSGADGDEASSGSDDNDDGDFLELKGQIGMHDSPEDPEKYKRFLMEAVGGKEESIREILASQRDEADIKGPDSDGKKRAKDREEPAHGSKGKGDEDEDFLVNYILNRGWMDTPSAAQVSKSQSGALVAKANDEMSDDSFEDRADDFETAYNFRFQELQESETNAQIQSFARRIEGSARRKEEKRKREREERAQRKRQEKEEKKAQLNKVRDLKRKSIVEKLKALKEATGSTAVDFEDFDLEGDFDPDEHDRLMAKAFNEDYYGEDDDKKPTWSDGSDIDDVIGQYEGNDEEQEIEGRNVTKQKSKRKQDKKTRGKGKGAAEEEGRIEMDADFIDSAAQEAQGSGGRTMSKAEKKKLKKREKAKAKKAEQQGDDGVNVPHAADGIDESEMDADAVNDKDLSGLSREERKKKMDAMMDEYYGLEYEDMIGDQPTRFKYTQVPKSDFGLTAEEILLADDGELNNIISLKRLQPYRRGRQKPSNLNARVNDFRRNLARKSVSRDNAESSDQTRREKRPGKRERERKARAKEAAQEASAGNGNDHASSRQVEQAPVEADDSINVSKKRKADSTRTDKSAKASDEYDVARDEKKHKKQKKEKKAKRVAA